MRKKLLVIIHIWIVFVSIIMKQVINSHLSFQTMLVYDTQIYVLCMIHKCHPFIVHQKKKYWFFYIKKKVILIQTEQQFFETNINIIIMLMLFCSLEIAYAVIQNDKHQSDYYKLSYHRKKKTYMVIITRNYEEPYCVETIDHY